MGRKMQDDLTWGVKHLVAQGIVDEKRVGIIGGAMGLRNACRRCIHTGFIPSSSSNSRSGKSDHHA